MPAESLGHPIQMPERFSKFQAYSPAFVGTVPDMADKNPTPPKATTPFDSIEHSRKELREQRVARSRAAKRPVMVIDPEEVRKLLVACQTAYLTDESLDRLWMIFMFLMKQRSRRFPTSEKSDCVMPADLGVAEDASGEVEETPATESAAAKPKTKRPNHRGPLTAADFPSAERHAASSDLKPGQLCGCGGKLRLDPSGDAPILRFVGRPPIEPEVYERCCLRCSRCQQRYSTASPEAGRNRHKPSAITMVADLKYGSGMPFYRLSQMLERHGVPLAPTTLYQMVLSGAKLLWPAFLELLTQGAQGVLFRSDDTRAQILEGFRPEEFGDRTGTFTTGLQCQLESGARVAIFATGPKHAGENLTDLLRRRRKELEPPIHMSDGSSSNTPKSGSPTVIDADCMVHGRRYFVKIFDAFPEPCRYVLESFGLVYAYEAQAKADGLSASERLAFHQQKSQPVLAQLHQKMRADLDESRVEENSPLGKAYLYLLKRWHGLTVFLREPGAPLDNNELERQLKKAVLHRKNALFYRSDRGALVGDLYMTLIKTCELNGVNPFDYLNQLQTHEADLAATPAKWLPWNYTENFPEARAA